MKKGLKYDELTYLMNKFVFRFVPIDKVVNNIIRFIRLFVFFSK